MKEIEILEDFTGYPSGERRDFVKGESVDVPGDFADLVIGKGHATEPDRGTVPSPPTTNTVVVSEEDQT